MQLESILPSEKRIEFLDSLVEKFLTAEPTEGEVTSLADKEDISSIFLEVILQSYMAVLFKVSSILRYPS